MGDGSIRVVPANEASWDDLMTIFGGRGEPAKCQCQRIRMRHSEWRGMSVGERAARLRAQTRCGAPRARSTSGLVGYLDGAPVGWCAVGPRPDWLRLLQSQSKVPWEGRDEDRADPGVWAVVCFVTRAGFRRRGVSRAMAAATPGFARARGARALEGYPMITRPGEEVIWGELSVGARSVFVDAGFVEVSRPGVRRCVMRIDFGPAADGHSR